MPFDEKPQSGAVEKVKEMADKALKVLPQSLQDKLEEMHAIVDSETAKEVVYKNAGKVEYAAMAAKATMESQDPKPLDQFLRPINSIGAEKIPHEQQLALLEAAKRSRPLDFDSRGREPNKFDEAANTYALISRLPEAQKALVDEYQAGLEKGYYKNETPAFVISLPEPIQKQIHDQNPDAFARSFPDSPLTKGAELQKLVDFDISNGFGGTALRMKDSFVGRQNSVLNNPNLTSEQVNNLAKTFLEIKPGDDFVATEAVSRVFMKFYHNQGLNKSNRNAMIARFGKQIGVNA